MNDDEWNRWFQDRFTFTEENRAELDALLRAQEGNPVPLANLILSGKGLDFGETRSWVAARLKGEKQKQGAKRTSAQKIREFMTWCEVQSIELKEGVKEHRAIELLCERNSSLKVETVRTYVRRAKADWAKLGDNIRADRRAWLQMHGSGKPES